MTYLGENVMSLLSVAAWLFAGLLTLVALAGLAVAYFVVKSMRSPPFRVNTPGGSLPSDGPAVHFLWKPHITDPLTNFGIPFTNIDIPSAKEGLMLRGWLVDGRVCGQQFLALSVCLFMRRCAS